MRDLVYYMGLAAFLLTLNWYFLESERVDKAAELGRTQIAKLRMLSGLLLLNVIALNLWLAPVAAAGVLAAVVTGVEARWLRWSASLVVLGLKLIWDGLIGG